MFKFDKTLEVILWLFKKKTTKTLFMFGKEKKRGGK